MGKIILTGVLREEYGSDALLQKIHLKTAAAAAGQY